MTTGTLSTRGQIDWLRVPLLANQAYLINIGGLSQHSQYSLEFGDPAYLQGQYAGSNQYVFGDAVTTAQAIWFEPSVSGNYYIEVQDVNSAPGTVFNVTVAAIASDTTDNATTTKSLTVGSRVLSTVMGTLTTAGQHDWVSVSLVADHAYDFIAMGLGANGIVRVGTTASLDRSHSSYAYSGFVSAGASSTVWFEPAASGTYYVDVSAADGVSHAYTVAVQELELAAGVFDNPSTTKTIAVGGTASGTLSNAGEHAWIAASLVANQAYKVTVTGLDSNARVVIGTTDNLDDSSQLGQFVTSGGTAQTANLWIEPATSGTYYIDISDGSLPRATYSISLQPVGADTTNNATTGKTIAVGGTITGSLSTIGQHDWVAVNLSANQAYAFAVTGLTGYASVEIGTAPVLSGTYADGSNYASQLYTFTGAASATSLLWFEPSTSGTFYIDVSDTGSAVNAGYTITARGVMIDTTNNITTSKTLSVGGSVSGQLNTVGQHDWVAVSLTANQAYLFTVTGLTDRARVLVGTAAQLDRSTSAYGFTVPTGQVPQTPTVWFMPPTSGTYYVDISDGGVGAGAPWTLTAAAVAADYRDNVTTSGLVLACFAAGTRLARADGRWTAVEDLRAGDLLRAHFAGAAEVVWTGHRRLRCALHPRPADVWPVRVRVGAFGPGQPARDVVLSPDHAVLVGGALIPVRALVDGESIVQERWDSVTYWHVELAAHDVVFAEGLPAESYLDTGNRNAFVEAGEVALVPLFARPNGGCAPLVARGSVVDAARAMLRANVSREEGVGWASAHPRNASRLVG